MNTYRLVILDAGRWGVEWAVDGQVQGLLTGTFDSEAEAAFRVYELARLEMEEAPR
jgi:hypothetical protein